MGPEKIEIAANGSVGAFDGKNKCSGKIDSEQKLCRIVFHFVP